MGKWWENGKVGNLKRRRVAVSWCKTARKTPEYAGFCRRLSARDTVSGPLERVSITCLPLSAGDVDIVDCRVDLWNSGLWSELS